MEYDVMYKIRHKESGRYIKKGSKSVGYRVNWDPAFEGQAAQRDIEKSLAKVGKGATWTALRHVKSHIRSNEPFYSKYGQFFEVVGMVTMEKTVESVVDIVNYTKERQAIMRNAAEIRAKNKRIKELKDEIKRLEEEDA